MDVNERNEVLEAVIVFELATRPAQNKLEKVKRAALAGDTVALQNLGKVEKEYWNIVHEAEAKYFGKDN